MNRTVDTTRIVFILGIMPRSGTHFLANLLCRHPDCAKSVIPEDCLLTSALSLENFANRSYGFWEKEGGLPDIPLQELLLESIGDGLKDFLLRAKRKSMAGRASLLSPKNALSRTPKYLVTKTPQVVNLDKFFGIFPNEKLLIIIRDGRTLVESIHRSFDYGREEAIKDWAAAADGIASFDKDFKSDPEKYLIIKYEELHVHTEREMRKILAFLELDTEKYDFQSALNVPVVGSSVFKRGSGAVHWTPVIKTDEFDPLSRATNWTRSQHERFNWLAQPQLLHWGYEPVRFEGNKRLWRWRNRLLDFKESVKSCLIGSYKLLRFVFKKLKNKLKHKSKI